MTRPELLLVAGARPNFMKVAPICRALAADGRLGMRLVHTGQHYDPLLSDRIMQDLGMPAPDHHLEVGSAPASLQTAKLLEAFDPLLVAQRPAAVLVVGDVTSTLAAGLAAANQEVPLVHVEAGLRSRDWRMPEERNRVLVDRLSRWLFVTERSGVTNLGAEGIDRGVHLVGNCMIDSLLHILPKTDPARVQAELGLADQGYAVMTMHRPGNVDNREEFARLLQGLAPIAAQVPLVFPVHPRSRAAVEALDLPPGMRCVDPLGYLDFVALVRGARLCLTDSGGLQEETTVLGVPCITLRPNTERPITVEIGSNELVHEDVAEIQRLGQLALDGEWKASQIPELWDGQAAPRIVAQLAADLIG